ncbi:hypothetical protein SCANM124S_00387 [Streptomyces canus]
MQDLIDQVRLLRPRSPHPAPGRPHPVPPAASDAHLVFRRPRRARSAHRRPAWRLLRTAHVRRGDADLRREDTDRRDQDARMRGRRAGRLRHHRLRPLALRRRHRGDARQPQPPASRSPTTIRPRWAPLPGGVTAAGHCHVLKQLDASSPRLAAPSLSAWANSPTLRCRCLSAMPGSCPLRPLCPIHAGPGAGATRWSSSWLWLPARSLPGPTSPRRSPKATRMGCRRLARPARPSRRHRTRAGQRTCRSGRGHRAARTAAHRRRRAGRGDRRLARGPRPHCRPQPGERRRSRTMVFPGVRNWRQVQARGEELAAGPSPG